MKHVAMFLREISDAQRLAAVTRVISRMVELGWLLKELQSVPVDELTQRLVESEPEKEETTESRESSDGNGHCPDCGAELVVRRNRFGKQFVGCSSYPECRHTEKLATIES